MSKSDNIRLNMLGLPLIQDVDDFSKITHISKYTIYQLSKHSDKYYKTYTIPKKSGKPRTICQPSKKLKGLQSWLLVNILDKLKVSNSCKGFEKGTSTASNAEPHKNANTILTIDLKDFFPTVKRNQVYNIFKAIGYNDTIATVMTNICTFEEALPQGSPCSPKLANLSAWTLDVRIQGYVGKRGINYTRYADDLSFSGLNPSKVVNIIPMIKTIIEDEAFFINPSKTRIAGSARAKIVTGLVISNDNFGIGKEKYKIVRAKIHHLTLPKEQGNIKLLYHVNGWISYLNSVDKKRFLKAKKYIKELALKHPDTLVTKLGLR
jgi:RNA-directed DNA polymerase